jgi:hypothetical protein
MLLRTRLDLSAYEKILIPFDLIKRFIYDHISLIIFILIYIELEKMVLMKDAVFLLRKYLLARVFMKYCCFLKAPLAANCDVGP